MSRFNGSTSRSASPTPSALDLEPDSLSIVSTAPSSSCPSSPAPSTSCWSRCASTLPSINGGDEDMDAEVTFDVSQDGGPGMDMVESSESSEFNIKEDQFKKLNEILQKSALFSQILQQRMESDKQKQAEMFEERKRRKLDQETRSSKIQEAAAVKMKGKKRLREDPSAAQDEHSDANAATVEEQELDIPIFPQPSLVTGANMMNHQLEGLQWMVALHQNGISGILGDEMGLGKTLQTIAFAAYLLESDFKKPFLIVCPLSVLSNWVDEFQKFAPGIPICMYHGTPAERAQLRRTVMIQEEEDNKLSVHAPSKTKGKGKARKGKGGRGNSTKNAEAKGGKQTKLNFPSASTGKKATGGAKGGRTASKRRKVTPDETEDEAESLDVEETASVSTRPHPFPVVITTYEIIIKDRSHLQNYQWGYIVVDEGHRLKNINCRLIKEVKKLSYGEEGKGGGGRMILTGTPLHNNLAELWSLLNFVLPDIFSDIETFQDLFNLPTMQNTVGSERAGLIISSLHGILKPFLLRRMKSDVFKDDGTGMSRGRLPPKKEYVLYAPLSEMQKELYEKVVSGGLRGWLIKKGFGNAKIIDVEDSQARAEEINSIKVEEENEGGKEQRKLRSQGKAKVALQSPKTKGTPNVKSKDTEAKTDGVKTRWKRKVKGRKGYDVDGDDDEYFEMLEKGMFDERGLITVGDEGTNTEDMLELGRQHEAKAAIKQVNSLKLQNTVMQLRKVCCHPFLFDWPINPSTRELCVDDRLLDCSGKMMVLERLLDGLFSRGHKVLLFSQFTKMLDIIEDWATEIKSIPICRIDGSTSPSDRRAEVERFQNGGDADSAPVLFLLSTRAGGLGINLTAADTVIFYDQDWNPQMDIQAQDRAHRIGQTKPVLIYRLVSAHTIEEKIMQRATEKRRLEALVIAKGKFKMPGATTSSSRSLSLAELASDLLALEGEKINVVPNTRAGKKGVLSDEDLAALLDRSDEVFTSSVPIASSDVKIAPHDALPKTEVGKAAFSVYSSKVPVEGASQPELSGDGAAESSL